MLTELLSWQSIFLLQAPSAGRAARPAPPPIRPEPGPGGPNESAPEFALGLLSAGLTAALFLLVILLTEGWGLSPIAAAARRHRDPGRHRYREPDRAPPCGSWIWALAGTIAVAGGLLALGVLPGASADLTLAPQLLIGAGLAMALPVLTAAAVEVNDPDGSRAASTIAARHAGIVVGILLLTPLLSAQLDAQHEAGTAAGTALLLDADLSAETKVRVGERDRGCRRRLRTASSPTSIRHSQRCARAAPEEQGRPSTSSRPASTISSSAPRLTPSACPSSAPPCSRSPALIPIAILVRAHGLHWRRSGPGGTERSQRRRARRDARWLPVIIALGVSLGVVVAFLLAGGASYKPLAVADPCQPRSPEVLAERGVFEGILLSGLDGAACELGVSREELVTALADDAALDEFSPPTNRPPRSRTRFAPA